MEVIYSDSDIIVLNKPAGISVHGGGSVIGATVADFLLERFPEIAGIGEDPLRPGIVHRLDRDTSGVMVVARNQKSFMAIKRLFQTRAVTKVYRAIVCGAPQPRAGVISFPVGRLIKNPTKRAADMGRGGVSATRQAETEYRVLKAGEKYSLIELRPKTGRMHQLRVHMAALHRPIACDKKYGGKDVCCPTWKRGFQAETPFPTASISGEPEETADAADASRRVGTRQLLHAQSLSFSFPEGRRMSFDADPPEDFFNAIAMIDSKNQ